MTHYRIGLFAIALLAAGCSGVPAPQAQQLKTTSKSYDSVTRGQTLAQIEQNLGPALRQQPDGAYYWETRYDQKNYVSLEVWFDAAGRAQRIDVTRGHGVNLPGVHGSRTFTKEK